MKQKARSPELHRRFKGILGSYKRKGIGMAGLRGRRRTDGTKYTKPAMATRVRKRRRPKRDRRR